MDWELLLLISPLAVFLWWTGFVATKQMRIGKNQEREELAKRLLPEKAVREVAENAAHSTVTEQKEQESH